MSTIVYQKLVSTTTLKLKVTSPPSHTPSTIDLCFLQSVPKKQSSYVHPLDKKSSFSRRLSEKSLQVCSENLGSESGSDIVTDDITFLSNSSKKRKHKVKSHRQNESNQSSKTKNFPPPLTTMSGSTSLQVRRRKEGGRLIIEVVEAPFRNTYLQAERSDGRLRLSFLRGGGVENDDVIEVEMNFVRKSLMEIEKFQRMRQGLCSDWKPAALWVASS